jgi:hypothetical protein
MSMSPGWMIPVGGSGATEGPCSIHRDLLPLWSCIFCADLSDNAELIYRFDLSGLLKGASRMGKVMASVAVDCAVAAPSYCGVCVHLLGELIQWVHTCISPHGGPSPAVSCAIAN